MDKQTDTKSPSIRQHKHELTWQILVPFLLLTLIILGAAAFTITQATSSTSLWRDISIIWLLVPALLMALALLAVLIVAIIGLTRLTKATPRVTTRIQELAFRGARGIQRIANGSVKPFIWMQQASAAFRAIFKR